MNRKVKYAKLHQSIHSPEGGQLGVTFEVEAGAKAGRVDSKTLQGLDMTLNEYFLFIKFKAQNSGKPIEMAVPVANVAAAQLQPE